MIFEAVQKWDGITFHPIATPLIKQIAGRAGRFGMHVSPSSPDDIDDGTKSQQVPGEVTTMDEADLPAVEAALAAPIVHLKHAILTPSRFHLQRLASVLSSKTSFSQLLKVASFLGVTSSEYFLPAMDATSDLAMLLDKAYNGDIPLPMEEQATFAAAPVNLRDEGVKSAFMDFAKMHIEGTSTDLEQWATDRGALALIKTGLEQKDSPPQADSKMLLELESFHRALSLYLWLSHRFILTFDQADLAREYRRQTEKAIDVCLAQTRFARKKKQHKLKSEDLDKLSSAQLLQPSINKQSLQTAA